MLTRTSSVAAIGLASASPQTPAMVQRTTCAANETPGGSHTACCSINGVTRYRRGGSCASRAAHHRRALRRLSRGRAARGGMYRHLPRFGGPADPLRGVAFGAGSAAAAGSPDTPHVAEKLAARLRALSEEERSVGLLPLLDPRAGRNGGVAARRFCGRCLRSR